MQWFHWFPSHVIFPKVLPSWPFPPYPILDVLFALAPLSNETWNILCILDISSSRMCTATKISVLSSDLGSPSMTSMDMSSHNLCRIDNSCKNLDAFTVSLLFCLQVSHSSTNLLISYFIPCQYKNWYALQYVSRNPECPDYGNSWSSSKIWFFIWEPWTKNTLLLYLNTSSCHVYFVRLFSCTYFWIVWYHYRS